MADWPLTSDLGPLGALPTAPRLARGFITVVLTGWGLAGLAGVAELLVSELATNVVQASTADDGSPRYDTEGKLPLLWVRLLSDRSRVMVEVWDNLPPSYGTPQIRHPRPDEESGRGLELIEALAGDWGWELIPGWQGKRVWALLPAQGPPGGLAPPARPWPPGPPLTAARPPCHATLERRPVCNLASQVTLSPEVAGCRG